MLKISLLLFHSNVNHTIKKMEDKKETVMIGDYLGTIEEFIPGVGTYAENGKIFAARKGVKFLDRKEHKAVVKGKKPLDLEVGQIVFGEVNRFRKNSVMIIVKKIQGFKEKIGVRMTLYISNISKCYIKKTEDFFGIGDIVKGKIIKIEEELIDISTNEPELGVVKAFCKRCRNPLVKPKKNEVQGMLVCENCSHEERRKIASDYGNISKI